MEVNQLSIKVILADSEDNNSIWDGRLISPVGNVAQEVVKNGEDINGTEINNGIKVF